MFRNWGFLITEMVGLLIIAALLGLFVGWLIWARRRRNSHTHDEGRMAQVQAELDHCRSKHSDKDARIAQLEAELAMTNSASTGIAAAATFTPTAEVDAADNFDGDIDSDIGSDASHGIVEESAMHARDTAYQDDAGTAAGLGHAGDATGQDGAGGATGQDSTGSAGGAADPDMVDYDGDGILEGTNEGTRPEALSAPRGGQADDLKRIKGIGPKLEQLCHSLGFYHFDQVANWTADEVAWVNANLEGFKGRVTRDNWVDQAKVLAGGGETEFSRRVDGGDMY